MSPPKPRWSMVISHHPPVQYDRTLNLLGIRLCARCSGVVVGIGIGCLLAAYSRQLTMSSIAALSAFFAAAIALGVSAFVKNEIGTRRSNNTERILFGIAVGSCLVLAWRSSVLVFLGEIVLIIVAQFVSAFWLRKHGHLDRFIAEYLEGAILDAPGSEFVKRNDLIVCGCATRPSPHSGECSVAPNIGAGEGR